MANRNTGLIGVLTTSISMTQLEAESATQLLAALKQGEASSFNKLYRLVYDELRARAHKQRMHLWGHNTMDSIALVNEVYFKLMDHDPMVWQSRSHFLGVAARAMRNIFLDYARKQEAKRNGGHLHRVSLNENEVVDDTGKDPLLRLERVEEVASLGQALKQLEQINVQACRVVECRIFGEMTNQETAEALGISVSTVKRSWNTARAWLYLEMKNSMGSVAT